MSELKDERLRWIEEILNEMIQKDMKKYGGEALAVKLEFAKHILDMLDKDPAYMFRFMYLLSRIFEIKSKFYLTDWENKKIQETYR